METKIARVHFDPTHLKFIDSLVSKPPNKEKTPFESRANVLGFAAAYSLKMKAGKKPLKKKNSNANCGADPIRYNEIMGDNPSVKLRNFITMLAFIDQKDPKILENTNEIINKRIKIFEEYANKGLSMLDDKLGDETAYTSSIIGIIKDHFIDEEADDLTDLLDD